MTLTWPAASWSPVTDGEDLAVAYAAGSDTLGAPAVGTTSTQKTPITANLEFTTVTVPSSAATGVALNRTFVVRNNGPSAVTGLVVNFTLSHPSAITCTGGTVGGNNTVTPSCTYSGSTAVNATRSIALNATAAQVTAVGVGNPFTVSATASSPLAGDSPVATASTDIVAQAANLEFTTVTVPASAPNGVPLDRTVVVRNNGPQAVSGLVVSFTLSHPSVITCTGGTVGGNNTVTPSCTYSGSTAANATRSITLNATAAQVNAVGVGNSFTVAGSATSSLTPVPATMSASTAIVAQSGELEFSSVTIPEDWALGAAMTRTVVVRNNGPTAVTGLTVNFTLSHPSVITCTGGTVGSNNTSTPSCTYADATAVNGTRSISLNATTAQVNAVGAGNSSTVSATATSPATAVPAAMSASTLVHAELAGMTVTGGANPATVAAGAQLQQVVNVQRTGPSAASNVRIAAFLDPTFPLPSTPTCSTGGAVVQVDTHEVHCVWAAATSGTTTRTMTLTYPAAATHAAGAGATVNNLFAVTSDTFGPDASTTRSATVTAAPTAQLAVAGVIGSSEHVIGSGDLVYTVDAVNQGPAAVNPFILQAAHDGSLGTPTVSCPGSGTATPSVGGGNVAQCQWANTTSGTSRQMVLTFPTAGQSGGVAGDFTVTYTASSTSIAVNPVAGTLEATTVLVAPPEGEGP
jgi:hypothetical protein